MRILPVFLLTLACASPQPRLDDATSSAVRSELLSRAARDQQYRALDFDAMPDSMRMRVLHEMVAVDFDNTTALKRIVELHGWPDQPRFGSDGAHAAWLLLQHADHDPEFQMRMLPVLTQASEQGTVSARDVAYLTDRVRVRQGLPQLYGTQYMVKTGEHGALLEDGKPVYLVPIVEDAERLDERRRRAGLGPWAEYERTMAEKQGRTPVARPRAPQ